MDVALPMEAQPQSYQAWWNQQRERITGGRNAAAQGRLRWINCPDLGLSVLDINLTFQRDVLFSQVLPPGRYISLVGECDFIPNDAFQASIERFSHLLAAVELTHSVPDPVGFRAGSRLQMLRFCLQPDQPGTPPMPMGKDSVFAQQGAYQTARLYALPPALYALCRDIWQCDWPGLAGELFAQAKVRELTAQLFRLPWQGVQHEQQSDLVNRAQGMMSRDLGANWTLARVARQLGTNETYLKQAFRETSGQGLSAWLRQARMAMACQWLEQTDWSISRIAEELGYSAANRFAAAFERQRGELPSHYRQRGRLER